MTRAFAESVCALTSLKTTVLNEEGTRSVVHRDINHDGVKSFGGRFRSISANEIRTQG